MKTSTSLRGKISERYYEVKKIRMQNVYAMFLFLEVNNHILNCKNTPNDNTGSFQGEVLG